ncbi:hypothetical protein [Tolypothrix sp. VBCCA 56010]|uniref:hypothetical protein n=1 Tax=Tolypothrix sp. VBCCA 56010 TaxID=3137731 RepID=UPI003D7CB8A9
MAIFFFSGDATRTDSYVEANVQISGYHITEEIYSGGRTLIYPDLFAVVIKQSTEASTRDVCEGQSLRIEILKLFCVQAAISLKNARLDQQAQLQLLQSKKMSPGNLVVGVAHVINNSVGLIAGNLQLALNEVFDVHN